MNYRQKDKRFSVSDERLTHKSGKNQLSNLCNCLIEVLVHH